MHKEEYLDTEKVKWLAQGHTVSGRANRWACNCN